MDRIPQYLIEVKRKLEAFTSQDWVSRLAGVIGGIGVVVVGVLLVEALFRIVVLLIVLVALGLGGRWLWLHRAMTTAAPQKDAIGRTIEGEYVVIEKRRAAPRKPQPSNKRKPKEQKSS